MNANSELDVVFGCIAFFLFVAIAAYFQHFARWKANVYKTKPISPAIIIAVRFFATLCAVRLCFMLLPVFQELGTKR